MNELEEKLGYRFKNRGLLEHAMTHSSYANEHRGAGLTSNERLEFLGDSVLGVVVADYLFHQHPDMPEGELTRTRAALVCEDSLVEVARELGLGEYLRLGKGESSGGGRERPSIQADAVEAVLAAIYLDDNGSPGEFLGYFEILDTGGDDRIKNGTVLDIYIPDYDTCIEFGRRKVVVVFIDGEG